MFKIVIVSSALAVASLGAFAQTATPRVDQREANQQNRIAEGVATGQLNRKEARRLEKEQGHIERAEAHAKADGVVTKHERKHLHRLQNAASKDIHQQKHDAQVAVRR